MRPMVFSSGSGVPPAPAVAVAGGTGGWPASSPPCGTGAATASGAGAAVVSGKGSTEASAAAGAGGAASVSGAAGCSAGAGASAASARALARAWASGLSAGGSGMAADASSAGTTGAEPSCSIWGAVSGPVPEVAAGMVLSATASGRSSPAAVVCGAAEETGASCSGAVTVTVRSCLSWMVLMLLLRWQEWRQPRSPWRNRRLRPGPWQGPGPEGCPQAVRARQGG